MRIALLSIFIALALPSTTWALSGDGAPLDDPALLQTVGTLHGPDAFCVATHIAPRWIITARHCADEVTGPVSFRSFQGMVRPVTRWTNAPRGMDVALGAIPDDTPVAPALALAPTPQGCGGSGPSEGIDTAWIASARHGASQDITQPITPWRGAIGRLYRDCSVYGAETTYFRGRAPDGSLTLVCGGDSGSPIIHDGALRAIVTGAQIQGGGNCANTPDSASGFAAPVDQIAQWIQTATASSPPRAGTVRVSSVRRARNGSVLVRWSNRRALPHSTVDLSWLRAGRTVRRDRHRLRPEWSGELIRRAPRAPGTYRIRIRFDGVTRVTPPFRLR